MAKENKMDASVNEAARDYPIECNCRMCGATTTIMGREVDYIKRIEERVPVQLCFSYLTRPQREAIVSGTCLECQKKLFSENYDSEGNWRG